MIKILSGLMLVLTIVIGLDAFLSDTTSFTFKEFTPLPVSPPPPYFLTRLSFLPRAPASPPLVAIVIENHEDARPFQKGLDRAVLISEFLVEGFISRFVALFSITDLPETVGPVRSLRPYFVDALRPWTSLFLFAGGSPDALEKIEQTTIPHANGLFLPEHFIRKESIAEPHNLFISKRSMVDLLATLRLTEHHSFLPPRGRMFSDQRIQQIHINFFNPLHNVTFTYDPLTASYERTNGTITTDTRPRNILIVEAPIRAVGEYGRLDIPLEGTGGLLFFQSGNMTKGIWHKDDSEHPFAFIDMHNQPLLFANGQIWMMVLETLERVKWE